VSRCGDPLSPATGEQAGMTIKICKDVAYNVPTFNGKKMRNIKDRFLKSLQDKKQILADSVRHNAVDIIEWETSELENIFAILVFGSFVGIPATPSAITLNLLPYMEKELQTMMEKVVTASGPISDLFSHLDTP